MSKDGIKGKIEQFIDEPRVTIEKAVKDLEKNKKFIAVIDSPGIAIEKGMIKGWEYIIYTGKGVKSNVAKKSKSTVTKKGKGKSKRK